MTASEPTDRPELTVEELIRWEDHGASWRTLALGDGVALVELCTCYGEPVDRRCGTAPELIAFVHGRRASGR